MVSADAPFPELLQDTLCEACGSIAHYDPLLQHVVGKPTEQPLWQCPHCRHVQVTPVPDTAIVKSYFEPSSLTRTAVATLAAQRSRNSNSRITRACRDRLAVLESLVPRGSSLLDIGYGCGAFLRAAYERGYKVSGIEPDRKRFVPDFPCELIDGDYESVTVPQGSFDVVTAHHILEQVPNLERTVENIFRALRPDGYLIVELPHDIRSLLNQLRRIYRPLLGAANFSYFTTHQHLRYFSTTSLKAFLERFGFEVLISRSLPASRCVSGPAVMPLLTLLPFEIALDRGHFQEAVARKSRADTMISPRPPLPGVERQ